MVKFKPSTMGPYHPLSHFWGLVWRDLKVVENVMPLYKNTPPLLLPKGKFPGSATAVPLWIDQHLQELLGFLHIFNKFTLFLIMAASSLVWLLLLPTKSWPERHQGLRDVINDAFSKSFLVCVFIYIVACMHEPLTVYMHVCTCLYWMINYIGLIRCKTPIKNTKQSSVEINTC